MEDFKGYHSEWNPVSPGGWDYQRLTQIIGRAMWLKLNAAHPSGVRPDFSHPQFYPVNEERFHNYLNKIIIYE